MSDHVNTWSDGIFRRRGSAYSRSSLRSGMRLSARNAIEMLMLPLNPVDSLAVRSCIPRDEAGFYPRRKARKDSWKSIFDSVIMSLCSPLWIPALWTFLVIRVQRFCFLLLPLVLLRLCFFHYLQRVKRSERGKTSWRNSPDFFVSSWWKTQKPSCISGAKGDYYNQPRCILLTLKMTPELCRRKMFCRTGSSFALLCF